MDTSEAFPISNLDTNPYARGAFVYEDFAKRVPPALYAGEIPYQAISDALQGVAWVLTDLGRTWYSDGHTALSPVGIREMLGTTTAIALWEAAESELLKLTVRLKLLEQPADPHQVLLLGNNLADLVVGMMHVALRETPTGRC